MLSAEKISKTFGPQTVLKDISLILGDQERIGIVGINGAGKSTFVKILAGIEEADKGVVNRHGSTVGYLNQESQCRLGVTIADEMRDAFPNVEDIEARLMKASHAVADGDMSRADAAALDAAANDLVRADAHTIDARIGRVLAGLGFELDAASREQVEAVLLRWPWAWKLGDLPQQAPPALGTRLRMELELLLEREPWDKALQRLQQWGGLALLDPGLQRNRYWWLALQRATRWQLPLLPVLIACADDPVGLAARLQLPHRQQRWLKSLVQLRQQTAQLTLEQCQGRTPAEWTEWIERQPDPEHVAPMALACGDPLRRPLLRWWLRWRHVQAGTTARELLASGMRPGPAVGARLRELRAERLRELECR